MTTAANDSHPLRLLAGAVVGLPIAITYLIQARAQHYSDGERIYLAADTPLEERRWVVMVQGALIAARSLSSSLMRSLIGRPDLAQRYLVLEVERSCRALAERLPSAFLERIAPCGAQGAASSPAESLVLARGRQPLPDPPSWYGTLQPLRIVRKAMQGGEPRLTDQKLAQLESRLKAITEEPADDDESLRKTSLWKFLTSPIGRDTMISRFMRELLDTRSSPGRESAESGTASAESVSGRASSRIRDISMAIRSSIELTLPSAFAQSETCAHSYPEWDCDARDYRPHWVGVEETEPHGREPHLDAGVWRGSHLPFQRALDGLYLGYRRHRDQTQGDDLVLDRVIRLAVDLRSGHSADPRVYAANLRTRRDLGVLILLDASSSTLERCADGARIFDLQAATAWKLCRAFETLGDRVAMHGFNSWGRTLVRFQTLKTYDQRVTAGLEDRLRHLAVAGYTRTGAALRHATTLIQAQAGTPYRLLVLISDGYPYDDRYEGEYAREDTRKAIEEAAGLGVASVCLSVGSDADEARLEQVYGAGNYLAVTRTEQLVPRLHRLVEAAIAAALRHAGRNAVRKAA